ncbi:hypothetical protein BDZ90DRAFT_230858 [Jaminaea rosea]|uniref:SHOCT domain-containing protein n=1 Tax=Jaminaea rosea TaxID=1569628 RepID=A0A316UVM7_9BASI|nr:hypothetical protein BDZ90DRAFT_230858 [Jaminaea rosea]PWN28848.1 hypothetical protein BDZ90DRAFT_230858 [Jaminaea rosea]
MKSLFAKRGSRSSSHHVTATKSTWGKGRRPGDDDDGDGGKDDGNLYYTPPAAVEQPAGPDAGIGSVPPPKASSSSASRRLSKSASLGTITGLVAAASSSSRKPIPPSLDRKHSNQSTTSITPEAIPPSPSTSSSSTSTTPFTLGRDASRRLSSWKGDVRAKRKQGGRDHPPSSYHFDDGVGGANATTTKRKDANQVGSTGRNEQEDLHPAVFVVGNPSVSVSPPTPRPRTTSTMSNSQAEENQSHSHDGGNTMTTSAATTNTNHSNEEPDTTETHETTFEAREEEEAEAQKGLILPVNGSGGPSAARESSSSSSNPAFGGVFRSRSSRSKMSKVGVNIDVEAASSATMPAAAAAAASPGPPLSPSALARQLDDLAVSHGDGLLSDDEYRKLRQRLLERSVGLSTATEAPEDTDTLVLTNRRSVIDLEDEEDAAGQAAVAQENQTRPPSPTRSSRTLPSMFKRASVLVKSKRTQGSSVLTSTPPSSWTLRRPASKRSLTYPAASGAAAGPLTESQVGNENGNSIGTSGSIGVAPSSASAVSSGSSAAPRSLNLKPGMVTRMLSTRSTASSRDARSISDDGHGDRAAAGSGSLRRSTSTKGGAGGAASSLAPSSTRRRRLLSGASFNTTTSSERKAIEAGNLERDVVSMRQARSLTTSPAPAQNGASGHRGLARQRSRSLRVDAAQPASPEAVRSRAVSLPKRSFDGQRISLDAQSPSPQSATSATAAVLNFDDLDWQYSDKGSKEIHAEIKIVEAEGKRMATAFEGSDAGLGGADEAQKVAQRYEERLAFLRSKLRSAKIREGFAK